MTVLSSCITRRSLDGVLLLDKPVNLSSKQALMRVKYLLAAQKAGHTGTLDPLASGLLPLCFGEATKFAQDLLDAAKSYEATLALGASTTTGDAQGEVLDTRPVCCDEQSVQAALERFRGEILQIPPMYSALKCKGKPLYKYARAGLTLERHARPVTIQTLELIDCVPLADSALREVRIRVTCSKGTYVRVLAQDIGAALGCGAYLSALRRTGVGALTLANAVTLDVLSNADDAQRARYLRPLDTLLSTYPAARLEDNLARRFLQGQRLRLPVGFKLEPARATLTSAHATLQINHIALPRLRVYDQTAQLLGTARLIEGVLAPERLLAKS